MRKYIERLSSSPYVQFRELGKLCRLLVLVLDSDLLLTSQISEVLPVSDTVNQDFQRVT